MKSRTGILAISLVSALLLQAQAPKADAQLKVTVEQYDRAVATKDVATVKTLLAQDVLLYEHSVRNAGIEDVFENHLKPEIVEFEEMKMEFSDVRLDSGTDFGVLTRQYSLRGKLRGREINAKGNETIVWKKASGNWRIVHIHYSHPCPRPAPPKQ